MAISCRALFTLVVMLLATNFSGLAEAHAAGEVCPQNYVSLGDALSRIEVFTTAATFDSAHSTRGGSARARYNLITGTAAGSGGAANATIWITDMFTVNGPTAGTPISFTATLRFTGGLSVSCDGEHHSFCSLLFREGASNARSFSAYLYGNLDYCEQTSIAFDSTLVLNINRTVGETFPIRIEISAGQESHGGGGGLSTVLEFSGLPPGTSISSCQGYLQESPIPTVPSTWSSIKSLLHENRSD